MDAVKGMPRVAYVREEPSLDDESNDLVTWPGLETLDRASRAAATRTRSAVSAVADTADMILDVRNAKKILV